jgi:hypothetical protein
MTPDNLTCVADFCGYSEPGHFPTSYWAHWDGSQVVFGGDWWEVPNMPSPVEPTEDAVYQWAEMWVKRFRETGCECETPAWNYDLDSGKAICGGCREMQ